MNCSFRIISEWDTTMMFMTALSSDEGFLRIFLEKTPDAGTDYTIKTVYRSKLENNLGETDLQVVYEVAGETHAILIENKIDASETPRQYERYRLRAQKGLERGEYSKYFIFMLCPDKYRTQNKEAQKYDHSVSYEECRQYFAGIENQFGRFCMQCLEDALTTAKQRNDTQVNPIAVDCLRKYERYLKEHYPKLDFRSNTKSGKVNGWWVKMGVSLSGALIWHKTEMEVMDLTITNGAEKFSRFMTLEKWLHDSGHERVNIVKTAKSVSLRIRVPIIRMYEPFESWNMEDLDECLQAAVELTELADMFAVVKDIFECEG